MNLLLIAAAASFADPETIVVSASREPVSVEQSGSAITVIDRTTIEGLDLPLASDLLRLSPGVAVAQSGPMGAQTQVRIRGAESNHTLVFVDGIEMNDPASSGDFLFETLLADGVDRIEVLRGPQSALWGSEALGGVVSVTTLAPTEDRIFGQAEAGSFGTYRAGAGLSRGGEGGGVTLQVSHLQSRGIDISGSGGDRDGYDNLTIFGKAVLARSGSGELGLVGRFTDSTSEFDDDGPFDANAETARQSLALRGYGVVTLLDGRWRHQIDGQFVDTANVNRRDDAFDNRTDGSRFKLGYQTSLTFATGGIDHRVLAAAEYEWLGFRSRDPNPLFSDPNQRQRIEQKSLIGEYRLALGEQATLTGAVRHDDNDRFGDATTFRAAGTLRLAGPLRAHASYGEGITNPTFIELFGYDPRQFIGNPNLRPERARGFDVGLALDGPASFDLTYFDADLRDEINMVGFSPSTVVNSTGRSKRRGVEVTLGAQPTEWLRLGATYTYLDATEPTAGGDRHEVRRPRHSGSASASATLGSFSLSASAAYVGSRRDFIFPPPTYTQTVVSLANYTLLTLAGQYRLTDAIELTARVENAGDADYEDLSGYATPGIAAYGGVRVRWGG